MVLVLVQKEVWFISHKWDEIDVILSAMFTAAVLEVCYVATL